MEENKVVLKLEDYIKMLDEIKECKRHLENLNYNYDRMCNYLKEQVTSSDNYHLKNLISDNVKVEDTLNVKLKNYHYENLFNSFIKVGITFDLIEKLIDDLITEYSLDKENKE